MMKSALYFATAVVAAAHPNHGTLPTTTSAPPEAPPAELIGHGDLQYRVHRDWSTADKNEAPVVNAHAIIEDQKGELYLVTDHPENAFLVYKKDGTFVRAFGKGIPGGHGIDVITIDGKEHLLHVDCGWHVDADGKPTRTNGAIRIVAKDGTVVRSLPSPHQLGLFDAETLYQPCDVAVTPDNDILVVDG